MDDGQRFRQDASAARHDASAVRHDYSEDRLDLLQSSVQTLNREMGVVMGELKTIRKLGTFDLVGRVAEVAALVIILAQLL